MGMGMGWDWAEGRGRTTDRSLLHSPSHQRRQQQQQQPHDITTSSHPSHRTVRKNHPWKHALVWKQHRGRGWEEQEHGQREIRRSEGLRPEQGREWEQWEQCCCCCPCPRSIPWDSHVRQPPPPPAAASPSPPSSTRSAPPTRCYTTTAAAAAIHGKGPPRTSSDDQDQHPHFPFLTPARQHPSLCHRQVISICSCSCSSCICTCTCTTLVLLDHARGRLSHLLRLVDLEQLLVPVRRELGRPEEGPGEQHTPSRRRGERVADSERRRRGQH